MEHTELLEQVRKKAQVWLGSEYDEETRNEVQALLDKEDPTDLIEAFYKDLEFGTGGLRGIMGVGSNRMNIYTVGAATQGLSNYLKKEFAELEQIKVSVTTVVTIAAGLPRFRPKFFRPTASRCIFLKTSDRHRRYRMPSVSWDVRAVLS